MILACYNYNSDACIIVYLRLLLFHFISILLLVYGSVMCFSETGVFSELYPPILQGVIDNMYKSAK